MKNDIQFNFLNPKESSGYLLGQLTMLWQRKQKQVLDPLDLTLTQFILLASIAWLSKENDKVTQIEIANQSNSDRMMVSKVLRTLEVKKFITRKAHKIDTRAKVINLTKSGSEILQKAIVEVENVDHIFFSVLSSDLNSFNDNMLKLIEKSK
jgi:DNA-binding MarR family transcriptional regulator